MIFPSPLPSTPDEPVRRYRFHFDRTIYARPLPPGMAWPMDLTADALEQHWTDPLFVHNNMEDDHHVGWEYYFEHAEPSSRIAAFYDDDYFYLLVHCLRSKWVEANRSKHIRRSWDRIELYVCSDGSTGEYPNLLWDETGRRVGEQNGWDYTVDDAHADLPDGSFIQAGRFKREEIEPLLAGRYGWGINVVRVESASGEISSLNGPNYWACANFERMCRVELLDQTAARPDDFHVRRVDGEFSLLSETMELAVEVWNADRTTPPMLVHQIETETSHANLTEIAGSWDGEIARFELTPHSGINVLHFTFGSTHFDRRVVFRFESGQAVRRHPVYDPGPPAPLYGSADDERRAVAGDCELDRNAQADDGHWPWEETRDWRFPRLRKIRHTCELAMKWLENYARVEQRDEYLQMGVRGMDWLLDQRDEKWDAWVNHDADDRPIYSVWGLSYHNGPIGAELVRAYEITGLERYRTAAERLLAWFDNEWHIDNNNNYDAFGLYFLGPYYRLSGDEAVLDRAIGHLRFGTLKGQMLDGSFPGHNEYGWYHHIILTGVGAILEVLPDDHPYRPELTACFVRAINRVFAHQSPAGGFYSHINLYARQHYFCYIAPLMRAAVMFPDAGLAADVNLAYAGQDARADREYLDWKARLDAARK